MRGDCAQPPRVPMPPRRTTRSSSLFPREATHRHSRRVGAAPPAVAAINGADVQITVCVGPRRDGAVGVCASLALAIVWRSVAAKPPSLRILTVTSFPGAGRDAEPVARWQFRGVHLERHRFDRGCRRVGESRRWRRTPAAHQHATVPRGDDSLVARRTADCLLPAGGNPERWRVSGLSARRTRTKDRR